VNSIWRQRVLGSNDQELNMASGIAEIVPAIARATRTDGSAEKPATRGRSPRRSAAFGSDVLRNSGVPRDPGFCEQKATTTKGSRPWEADLVTFEFCYRRQSGDCK